MAKLKRIVWLMKTYGISICLATYTVFVSDPKLAKEND